MDSMPNPNCAPPVHPTPPAVPQIDNQNKSDDIEIGGQQIAGIGSFHKTLVHDKFGEVMVRADFEMLRDAGHAADPFAAYDSVRRSPGAGRLVNPTAGLGTDRLVPPYCTLTMPPAPTVLGESSAAEMVELYWMALLRDLSFSDFAHSPDAARAAAEINTSFEAAINDASSDGGKIATPTDAPQAFDASTLFRAGLPGEDQGPHISQFFLRNIYYGAQCIDQRVIPYKEGENYLTDYDSWMRAQNVATDGKGQSYGTSRPNRLGYARPILTPRDMATFVNQDALHQAYFNAALILDGEGYASNFPAESGGTPPRSTSHQARFVTWGGPHLLTLVSEVAARAMKVVWHQKWQVHLRHRPEAYGGMVQMQEIGAPDGTTRAYGLPTSVTESEALKRVKNKYGTCFLPMAFPSGSPPHPAYGAGHATVAGACVTILKAWFQDVPVKEPVDLIPASSYYPIDFPSYRPRNMPGLPPLLGYKLMVHGELNKLASNVAMGRSLGGVHWRTDNTRSLRLGEKIAIVLLAREVHDLVEKVELSFSGFDAKKVMISNSAPRTITITNPNGTLDVTAMQELNAFIGQPPPAAAPLPAATPAPAASSAPASFTPVLAPAVDVAVA